MKTNYNYYQLFSLFSLFSLWVVTIQELSCATQKFPLCAVKCKFLLCAGQCRFCIDSIFVPNLYTYVFGEEYVRSEFEMSTQTCLKQYYISSATENICFSCFSYQFCSLFFNPPNDGEIIFHQTASFEIIQIEIRKHD